MDKKELEKAKKELLNSKKDGKHGISDEELVKLFSGIDERFIDETHEFLMKNEKNRNAKSCQDDNFEKLLYELTSGIDDKFITEAAEYEKTQGEETPKSCQDANFEKLLYEITSGIDDKYITEAAEYEKEQEDKSPKSK